MATCRNDIFEWFDKGVLKNYDYMIVVCDTFDWGDYPVFVSSQNLQNEYNHFNGKNMQKVMEIYDLKKDKLNQLYQRRCFSIPSGFKL